MKISQKIGLSFIVIFALVFSLGAISVLSLRQIYRGVYESLRRDMPAIRESAHLGMQWAETFESLQVYLRTMDPSGWENFQRAAQESEKILQRLSSYALKTEEKELLQSMSDSFQGFRSLADEAKKRKENWQNLYQRFLKERDSLLEEITTLIGFQQRRLQDERDLLLIQSQYRPILNQLSNLRKKVHNFSAADTSNLELQQTLKGLADYLLTIEEERSQEKIQQGLGLFSKAAKDLFEEESAISKTIEQIGPIRTEIQTQLLALIEQVKADAARKTGLGVIFIEDIPATRSSAYFAIQSSQTFVSLESYLASSDEKDRRQYDQSRAEAQRYFAEYANLVRTRKQPQLLPDVEQVQTQLTSQSQAVLYLHQEQRSLLKELGELLEKFESEINLLISSLFMELGQSTFTPTFLQKIQLATRVQQAVSDSMKNLNRYPLTGSPQAREVYDSKLLEILQGLDQMKQMAGDEEKKKVVALADLFNQLRLAADDLIEAYANQQKKLSEKEDLELAFKKGLIGILQQEEEKNLLAREQLDRKVVLINGAIILIVLAIGFLGVLVIVYTRKAITKPIQELSQGAKVIGSGKLNYRLQLETGDELEDLAGEFNKMTKELQGLYTNLELKVEERTHQLALANQALAESNRELDDFTYIVSHDLKEPLRGIDAFSRFLLEDVRDKLDAKQKEYLESIAAASKRMSQLIADLLDLSRITRQRNPLESADFNLILAEVRKNLTYAITEKKIDLRVGTLATITCDRVRVQEVFHNLISNAIKYNDKPNPLIEVGCEQKENAYEFYVRDNGIGISKEHFDKAFKIFQRLPGSEKYEGTGAGLAIVKKIIEKHGGRIWVESEIGKGTTFYFTLPMKPVETVMSVGATA